MTVINDLFLFVFYCFLFVPFIFEGQDKCKKRSNKTGKGVKVMAEEKDHLKTEWMEGGKK